ncbi:MAG: flagellar hook-basal body complex protein FliE [Sphingomonadaceae bacterium]
MTGIDARLGLSGVMALRHQILERSQTLGKAALAGPAPVQEASPAGFREALDAVNRLQQQSDAKSGAFVRGETHDIADVMLARQKASIAFEATLQARNRLLGAYRDIMNMPV